MKDDAVYLKHILECIRRIEEDTRDGREKFLQTHTLQDAVLRNLQTLSESTQRLSEASRAKHPEVEWIWEIVQRDVPELERVVNALLKSAEGNA